MGRNAHADLVFGVPLGGSDEGFLLTGPKDEWDDVRLELSLLTWLTDKQCEEWDDLAYHEILELGLKHLRTVTWELTGKPLSDGLEVHQHGYELNSFALVLRSPQFNVSWGDVTEVNLQTLQHATHLGEHGLRFAAVFEALNLQPVNPVPRWFLTCDYF